MRNIFSRPLSFEQMEQKLALSAVTFSDLASNLQLHAANQGGAVSIEQVISFAADRGATGFNFFSNLVDIRGAELLFSDRSTAYSADGDAGEVNSAVSPIPQPQLGRGDIADGIIAVVEIFRPTDAMDSTEPQHRVARIEPVVDPTVRQESDESWKSISLIRGRDMYFEVASLSGEDDDREPTAIGLADEIVPLMYRQSALRLQAEGPVSTASAEDRSSSPAQSRPLSAPAVRETIPAAAGNRSELPGSDAAIEKPQRTAQEGTLPTEDEYSMVDVRDQAFDVWGTGDELGDEAAPLRNETQQGHSATWPALAALAVTGWLARSRRSTGILPSHRQPTRRKWFF